ncbi:MAG TPA: sensor histidine kinase, partial [Fibrella sp.]
DSMFARIEPVFQSMYTGFSRISNATSTTEEKQEALRSILQDEFPFLQQMNAIVFQFDAESFEQVKRLERIEWLLAMATVVTLLIEGLFIFRPVVNHTQSVIRRLASSEEALQLANRQMEVANQALEATNKRLAAANQQLLDTQQELLQTTEEKYQLQLAEDTVRSAALLEGQEEERRRFARELHDGIGQMLTGIKLHAEKLKSTTFTDEKQRTRFAELCDLIADTIQTTRQVSYNLMPSTLSDFGLGPTLNLLAEQTTRSAGIAIDFSGPTKASRLSPAMEISLYRIAQEALHNAVKYADAQTIRITLQQSPHKLQLAIEDDGKGFAVTPSAGPDERLPVINGLENMRTRTRLLNGDFTITSKPKKGTKVRVCVNLSDNAQ